jgi:hypothetical protein
METGPCSGWCAFTDGKVDCSNAEAGDCTPANYGPKETQDGDAYGMSTGAWESAQVARYVRHWSGRGQVRACFCLIRSHNQLARLTHGGLGRTRACTSWRSTSTAR